MPNFNEQWRHDYLPRFSQATTITALDSQVLDVATSASAFFNHEEHLSSSLLGDGVVIVRVAVETSVGLERVDTNVVAASANGEGVRRLPSV